MIFQSEPKKRYIPGMGSSMRPEILDGAHIDEAVFVSEPDVVRGCRDLYAATACSWEDRPHRLPGDPELLFLQSPLDRRPVVAFLAAPIAEWPTSTRFTTRPGRKRSTAFNHLHSRDIE